MKEKIGEMTESFRREGEGSVAEMVKTAGILTGVLVGITKNRKKPFYPLKFPGRFDIVWAETGEVRDMLICFTIRKCPITGPLQAFRGRTSGEDFL